MTAERHECPSWCHRCPAMRDLVCGGRDVMPGCMGGAIWNDLDHCTCVRIARRPVEAEVEPEWIGACG